MRREIKNSAEAELVADEWNASEDAELHQNEADEDDRPPKGDVAAHEAGLHLDQLLPEFHVSLLNRSISHANASVKGGGRDRRPDNIIGAGFQISSTFSIRVHFGLKICAD